MTFKHKLSKRLALMRDEVVMFAAHALLAWAGYRPFSSSTQPTFSKSTDSDSTNTSRPNSRVLRLNETPELVDLVRSLRISWWLAPVMFTGLVLFACIGDRPINGPSEGPTPPSFDNITSDPTILFQESFEDGAFASRGWYDNTSLVTTTAEHLPGSTRALELRYVAGATTPVAGGAARRQFTAWPTVYVSYWVKYSSNWVGSGQPYHPHEFLIVSDQDGTWDGPSQSWLAAYVEHNYQNGGIPRLQLQDNKAINTSLGALPINLFNLTENRSTSGCNGVVEANVVTTCFNMPPWYNDKEVHASQVTFQPSAGPGYKGDWNHVEAYFALNSITGEKGVADGVMQYWFNGALIIDRHDILFRTAARPTIQFDKFLIAPYIGDGSPVNQTMWVDDLIVASGRIASDPAPPPAPPPPPPSVPVAWVSISPASASVAAGGTVQLAATTKDSAGNVLTGRTVTWASSSNGVGTVSATGLVSGVLAGSATITATSEGVQGTAELTVTNPTSTKPGTVTDLALAGVTDSAVTLSFMEVSEGTGQPASYLVRFAKAPIAWGSAADVKLGSCKVPMAGATIGAKRSCDVRGLAPFTGYQFQLVPFRGTLNVDAVFGGLSNVVSGTTVGATPTKPGTVTDLAVSAVTDTSVTLSFTEIADGAGLPARYDVRFARAPIAWGSATSVTRGSCRVPLAGATIGARRTCRVLGLSASISYQFQLVAFRGTLNLDAVFGDLSNVASGTTAAKVMPVASVTVSPSTANLATGATQQLTATLKDSAGSTLSGRIVIWGSSNPAVATASTSGLVTGIAAGTAVLSATSEGVQGTAAVTVTSPLPTKPGTVSDLTVASATDSSVTLSFTEVGNGAGQPASYDVRWAAGVIAWGSAKAVTQGSCRVPVAGTAVGARYSCTVVGLTASTGYQFQMVAFRGTLNVDAVFGGLSNVANGTTESGTVTPPPAPPPAPPPPPPSGGVVFQSDWGTAVGTSATAVRDGNRWLNYWEFNGGTTVQLLSVVAGGPPGYANALKVVQRGSSYAANLQQNNVLPLSTDFYVRFYMRNDDNSVAGDHIVMVDYQRFSNLTFMRKYSGASSWRFVSSLYGCGYTYPIGHWGPSVALSNGAWYRFEYFVHFVDATHVQVHVRVYDAAGTQILGDGDMNQTDFGGFAWNGRNDWTWASYYAAGYSFCVDPVWVTNFALGNNGQQGAADTGLPWYFAGIQIRTDRWPGP